MKRHYLHYASLVIVLAIGTAGFLAFSYSTEMQTAIAGGLALAYFTWGLVHHSIHKDLTGGVVLEYLLFSILGYVILTSLILRY